jgi:murein DD-endopeptidase MepM/ murein hydrolase activator NlpD
MLRRLFSVILFFGLIWFLYWLIKDQVYTFRLVLQEAPVTLPIPVQGVVVTNLQNTWGAPRSQGREHQGIDIFAPRGTAVFAATHGVVWKMGQNRLGGNAVWILGPGAQMHYYAHLDRFADIAVGNRIFQGEILGFVGNTGNARGTPPHLHYGIYTISGQPINPYPMLSSPGNIFAKLATNTRSAQRELIT